MNAISVLLADDHTILRKGLCTLLQKEANIEVVAEAEDGMEAISKVGEHRPDVVLMDISMPILNGLEATRRIVKRYPQTKVLILTRHTHKEYVLEILKAGASGFVVKKAAPQELVTAIQAVYRGESYLSPSVAGTVVEEYLDSVAMAKAEAKDETGKNEYSLLTNREREILQLIAEGHSSREIADLLFISVKTVENHRARLMGKLDLHNVAELTRYAIQNRIVSSDEE